MTLSPGQLLNNRYRIVKLLGQGGFGAVYQAWDANLDETVALKESFETLPEAQRQFQLEARLLFRLIHPNLPRVHDTFILPEQGMYLVMDFIAGEDLEAMLQRVGGPLPEAQVVEWIGQVCDALIYLHSQNPPIIHRDIKPANIRITPQDKAVLVDFGIAKVYDPLSQTTLGARAVTPGYSPNEQYLGGGRTDPRTDIYALGATLFRLLTGQMPPEAPERSLGARLPPLRAFNLAASVQVEMVTLRAMELLPEQRFTSASELKVALQPSVRVVPESPAWSSASQAHPSAPETRAMPPFTPPAEQQTAVQQPLYPPVAQQPAAQQPASQQPGAAQQDIVQGPLLATPQQVAARPVAGREIAPQPVTPQRIRPQPAAPQSTPLEAEKHYLSAALALVSLVAAGLGLFFLFQAPGEELVAQYCPRLSLDYLASPWLAAILLGMAGLGLTVWLLTGARPGLAAAGLGGLTILACLATLFILYQAPPPGYFTEYCTGVQLDYAIAPELTAGAILLTGGLWAIWLLIWGVRSILALLKL